MLSFFLSTQSLLFAFSISACVIQEKSTDECIATTGKILH